MGDGDTVNLGSVRLKTLETPGHTLESISILVFDRDRSETHPYAVLTGDTLFVGDVGRPDLRASLGWSASSLGNMLYESVQTKLMALPDDSLVYPAHGAGSLCGKALGKETFTTIGEQRRSNYALQPMTREAFVELVTANQPDAPAYFVYDAVLNAKEHPTLDQSLAEGLKPLTLDQLLAHQQGAPRCSTRASLANSPRRTWWAARTSDSAADADRVRRQAHRRRRDDAAQPSGRARPRAPARPAAARALRRRLSLVDRGQPAAAAGLQRGERAGRRHRRVGGGGACQCRRRPRHWAQSPTRTSSWLSRDGALRPRRSLASRRCASLIS